MNRKTINKAINECRTTGMKRNILWYPSSGNDVRPLFDNTFNSRKYMELSAFILNDTDSTQFRAPLVTHNAVIHFELNPIISLEHQNNNIPIMCYTAKRTFQGNTTCKKFLFINASNEAVEKLLTECKIPIYCIHSRFCVGTSWQSDIEEFERVIKQLKVQFISTDKEYVSFSAPVISRLQNCSITSTIYENNHINIDSRNILTHKI